MTATPPTALPLVTVDALRKRWDDDAGLRPISFGVGSGELVALQGRSGSGKSTVLALLAGWTDPDGGAIHWSPALGADGWPTGWGQVAIVPQVLGVVDELTVGENVELPLRLSGSTSVDAAAMAGELLDDLDLVEHRDRRPSETSLGQQQRLAVARALARRPLLVLADEPTSHQDVEHAATVMAAIRSRAGAALVASHDPALAAIADRVITLD